MVLNPFSFFLSMFGRSRKKLSYPKKTMTTQPPPTRGRQRVLDAVIDDLQMRAESGREQYGTYLETHNGHDALLDAYEEAQDLCMYLKQAILERNDHK